MKKIFWIIVLLCSYIWVVTTGHEQFVLDQSKRLYQSVLMWFNDAEVDLQIQQKSPIVPKKHSRRWD